MHASIWPLALPEKEVGAIVAAKESESWSDLQTQLEAVTSSCVLGQKLFGFVYSSMQRQFVRDSIKQAVEALDAKSFVSEAALADAQRALVVKLEPYLEKALIQKKTKPEIVMYRELELSIDAGSVYELIQLCFDAYVKGRAASTGELTLFGPESDIFGPCEKVAAVFEESSLARFKNAREYAAAVLAKGSYETAGAMQV
eukprot:1685577-Amphidinium_carterae.1